MDYEYFINLQQSNVGIGLLKARNLPLIASFLWQQFIQQNQRVWRADDLAEQLDNQLFDLRRRFDDESFPRTGSAAPGRVGTNAACRRVALRTRR